MIAANKNTPDRNNKRIINYGSITTNFEFKPVNANSERRQKLGGT